MGTKTTYTQSVLPSWYTNTGKELLASQQQLAQKEYTPYTGTRIAGFTPAQQESFNLTQQAATGYQPTLQQATEQTRGVNAMGGLQAAAPYLQQAGQSSVANVGQYMNPYMENVVNRIGTLGLRTLNEQLLPGISDRMVAAGQFGGTRQAELMGRALRDTMEGISSQQSQALSQGYTQALEQAGADLSRYGTLAGTIGNLYNTGTSNQLQQAAQLGTLAQQAQTQGLAGAQAMSGIGGQQQALEQKVYDTQYADFLKQQGYPQEQINAMLGTMQGIASTIPQSSVSREQSRSSTTSPWSSAASIGLTGLSMVGNNSGGTTAGTTAAAQ